MDIVLNQLCLLCEHVSCVCAQLDLHALGDRAVVVVVVDTNCVRVCRVYTRRPQTLDAVRT